MSSIGTLSDNKLVSLDERKDWTDCVFVFGDQKVSAHRSVLTCNSPVFQSMFYGPMASTEIHISDIKADDFKQMLEFIYMDTIKITSVINAWSLFYISQKYFINELKNVCVDYIGFNLTLSTLLLSYEYAELYNLEQLTEKCWRDILLSAKEILSLDYHMLPGTFCALLDENVINASEKDLIEAAIKWAEEECTLRNLESTKENKCDVLVKTGIFSKLRFACLGRNSSQYLYQLLADSSENVSDYVALVNSSTEQRHRLQLNVKFRFRETYKIEQNIPLYNGNEFECTVRATNKIAVYGVAITPPHQDGSYTASLDATISISDREGRLLCKTTDLFPANNDFEYPHLVNLPEGVTLDSNVPYRISVKYSNYSVKPNRLLCFYLSSSIKTHANSMSICFEDELYGGVIRGLSFYVI